jgi:circadian clock protein KaiB
VLAAGNLRRICEKHLKTNYRITIIDIVRQPAMARAHNILATPTLVHVRRPKDTTVVGTLADTQKVLQALGVSLDNGQHASALAPGFAQIGHA